MITCSFTPLQYSCEVDEWIITIMMLRMKISSSKFALTCINKYIARQNVARNATQSSFPVSGPCVGQFSLSYLTYVIRCNQFQHATTVFTQPPLSGFTIQASIFWLQLSAFFSLVPRTHPLHCILLFVHHFLYHFGFWKKTTTTTKKKRLVAWSFLSDL